MKSMQRTTLVFVLAGALALPSTMLLAGDSAAQTPGAMSMDMQTMRERMIKIHQTRDPEQRKALIDAQLKDMEAMMQDPDHKCPMADGKGGMGGGMGMMGQGMPGMMGKSGQDDMMARRMEMMEKRMDMMQTMMQMQNRMGGMGPGMGMGGGMGGMSPGMNMPSK